MVVSPEEAGGPSFVCFEEVKLQAGQPNTISYAAHCIGKVTCTWTLFQDWTTKVELCLLRGFSNAGRYHTILAQAVLVPTFNSRHVIGERSQRQPVLRRQRGMVATGADVLDRVGGCDRSIVCRHAEKRCGPGGGRHPPPCHVAGDRYGVFPLSDQPRRSHETGWHEGRMQTHAARGALSRPQNSNTDLFSRDTRLVKSKSGEEREEE